MALKLTTEQWITKALAIHGKKYNYSLVNYKDAKTPVVVSCKDHGEWNCNPSNHVNRAMLAVALLVVARSLKHQTTLYVMHVTYTVIFTTMQIQSI